MCCKLLPIDQPDFKKPAAQWCQHCRPGKGGCGIYATRPQVCSLFACQWLIDPHLGEEFWPARARMVHYLSEDDGKVFYRVAVEPDTPHRWREAPYYEWIKLKALVGLRGDLGFRFHTFVDVGERHWRILPDKAVEVTDAAAHVVGQTGPDCFEIFCFDDPDEARDFLDGVQEFFSCVDTLDDRQRLQLFMHLAEKRQDAVPARAVRYAKERDQ